VDLSGRADAWRGLADEVGQELVAWREAHPRATLSEIEDAVLEVTERLQARLLQDLAEASAAAAPGGVQPVDRARCPECGGELEPSGQAERMVQVARLEQGQEPAVREPTTPMAVQQVSADGAMIPLVGGAWAEVKTLAVGAVGAVAATREPDGTPGARAADLSYCSRLADAAAFTRQATVELARRGTEQAGVVVGVMDGAPWLQGFLDHHRPDAVRVLDFPHAVEHLATAAQATFGAGTPEAIAWLDAQAHALQHTGPTTVLAALRALPVEQARDPTAAAAARAATLGYLESRTAQLAYPRCRAAGYPIGSGAVESANKVVVQDRLKGSGMHWAPQSVNPMLALRTVVCADRWDEAWPAVCRHLRRQAHRRRLDRHHARHPRSSPGPTPATTVPPAPPHPRTPAPTASALASSP
jgi:hypothetical protein